MIPRWRASIRTARPTLCQPGFGEIETGSPVPNVRPRQCSATYCPDSICAHKPTPTDVRFIGLFPNIQKERIMLSPLTKNAIDHADRISIFKNLASHRRRKVRPHPARQALGLSLQTMTVKSSTKAPRGRFPLPYQQCRTLSLPPLPCLFPISEQVHAWIDMLTVTQPYFESDDFRGDVVLYAAFSHPLLKTPHSL